MTQGLLNLTNKLIQGTGCEDKESLLSVLFVSNET